MTAHVVVEHETQPHAHPGFIRKYIFSTDHKDQQQCIDGHGCGRREKSK